MNYVISFVDTVIVCDGDVNRLDTQELEESLSPTQFVDRQGGGGGNCMKP